MFARCSSMVMTGLTCTQVDVEVDGTRGQPSFVLIGLPNKAVDEARERISSALQNCGVRIRSMRTVVNLAPAEIHKTSSALELAIAVGLLKMYGEITWSTDNALFFGELSLQGEIKAVKGLFPMVLAAQEMGIQKIFFPKANSEELRIIEGMELYPVSHLRQVIQLGRYPLTSLSARPYSTHLVSHIDPLLGIVGHEQAKRAIHIAAAGQHNILFIGSPGAGKSMLARAMSDILPPLTKEEAIEITKLYSLRGMAMNGLVARRPFREPHHTSSAAGMLGGGHFIQPGEISLAHCGVLFLDELPEYSREVLEALRQPMESGTITLTRVTGSVTYPARFMLVAAANPCPCGYQYHESKVCKCTPREIMRYQKRFSGPVLDRIDLQLKMQSIDPKNFTRPNLPQPKTLSALQRVSEARRRQLLRQNKPNGVLSYKELQKFGNVKPQVWDILSRAGQKFLLSSRGYLKVLRVARTIADIEKSSTVEADHAVEALAYRIH